MESANWEIKSADSTADSTTDSPKVGMWVQALSTPPPPHTHTNPVGLCMTSVGCAYNKLGGVEMSEGGRWGGHLREVTLD